MSIPFSKIAVPSFRWTMHALRKKSNSISSHVGLVNRVTIPTDKFGQPKGFAYVEFVEVDAVQNALLLNESELHGRQLKVSAKRTNVPGIKQSRARRSNPFMAMAYSPPPFYSPYRFGKAHGSECQCDSGHTTEDATPGASELQSTSTGTAFLHVLS